LKHLITGISLLLALVLSQGCNTTGCLDNQSSIPLAGCYSSANGSQFAFSSVMRIHGVGAPGDSALSASSGASYRVYLPMRSTADNVSWCLHYTQENLDDDIFNDTITFVYTSIPYFASEECGAMYQYRIDECRYTTHLLDSVVVTDSLITNVDLERIKIYFRTQESGDDTPESDSQQ
jgi:lipoprotein